MFLIGCLNSVTYFNFSWLAIENRLKCIFVFAIVAYVHDYQFSQFAVVRLVTVKFCVRKK